MPARQQFALFVSASMDDVLVRVFDTEADALAFIDANPPYPSGQTDLNHDDVNNAYEVAGRGVSQVYGYDLVHLEDGKPTERLLFWWEDMDSKWTPAPGWAVDGSVIVPAADTVKHGEGWDA